MGLDDYNENLERIKLWILVLVTVIFGEFTYVYNDVQLNHRQCPSNEERAAAGIVIPVAHRDQC